MFGYVETKMLESYSGILIIFALIFIMYALAKGCANPGVPKNGFKHGLSYFINDVVGFSCLPCYQLVGNSQRTCLKNKTWSSTQPKCVCKFVWPYAHHHHHHHHHHYHHHHYHHHHRSTITIINLPLLFTFFK